MAVRVGMAPVLFEFAARILLSSRAQAHLILRPPGKSARRRILALNPQPERFVSRSNFRCNVFASLAAIGLIDGRNVRIDYRWSGGNAEDARKHATELVTLDPDALIATGGASIEPLRRPFHHRVFHLWHAASDRCVGRRSGRSVKPIEREILIAAIFSGLMSK